MRNPAHLHFRVASDALGFRDIGGMGIPVVRFVTRVAGQPGVGALFELLCLIVAGGAIHGGRLVGPECADAGQGNQKAE
jgi:hypothetical protein